MIIRKKIIHDKYFFEGEAKYFFVEMNQKRFAIPDKCPHRGGPLSLGKLCSVKNSIQCPWHDGRFKIASLLKNEVNAVRIKDEIVYYGK